MAAEAVDFFKHRQKVTLLLSVINVLVFIVLSVLGDTEDGAFMLRYGAAYTPLILEGEYWRLLTSMFLHFGLEHLLYNMLALLLLGDMLEKAIGSLRYGVIYMAGGLAGNLLSLAVDMHTGSYAISAGASGGIFAIIGACCYLALRRKMRGISGRRLGIITLLMLAQGFTEAGTDNWAHVGGAAAGFVLAFLLCDMLYFRYAKRS